ncbi:Lrp/AsnC family transcriptional regulator [Microbacterium petrolearium]
MGGFPAGALDELDRKIVVALQHDGRASWTSVAAFAGGSVSTVARRGQQLISAGIVTVGAIPTLGSEGPVQSFIVRINTTPGQQARVAERLIRSPYVRFLTLVTGKHDIVAEVVVPSDRGQIPHSMMELQQTEGIERWRSDLLTHTYKVSFDWGRQLYEQDASPTPPDHLMPPPNTCEPAHFDEVDRVILAELRHDGRATFQALGQKLGMSESSVRRRVDRMRADGCLTIVTSVPSFALGMGAETWIQLRVEPARINEVAEQLGRHVAVRFLAAGLDENSLFCEVILPSTERLHDFVADTMGKLPGVRGWSAYMELVFLKRGFMETRWWRSQFGLEA